MFCKRCGAALPSHGFICKSCGAMMDAQQIKKQKEYMKENKNQVNLFSDQYQDNSSKHNYEKVKENKFLGAILIILILVLLVIFTILKNVG